MTVLPASWIDKIFATFLGLYGSQFHHKFSNMVDGTDVGMALAKKAWAEELAGFESTPEAISGALKNLPRDYPPNAPQFADLCRDVAKRIEPAAPALTYTPDPDKAKAFAAELAKIVGSSNRGTDPIFWAAHPKSHMAFEFIRGAAIEDPRRFRPCIDHLISEGRVSEDGNHLLQRYAGGGDWFKA
jgi:hypothetical protein